MQFQKPSKIQYISENIFIVYEFIQLNCGLYFVYNKTDITIFWSAGAVECSNFAQFQVIS